jgi:hypothetical protein
VKVTVDYHDVCSYAEAQLPEGHRREIYCAKIWGYLFRNAVALGLVFYCPHCKQRCGRCRCAQLGSNLEGAWVYHIESAYNRQWYLDVASLLKADTSVLPKSRERTEAVYFIRHIGSRR